MLPGFRPSGCQVLPAGAGRTARSLGVPGRTITAPASERKACSNARTVPST